MKPLFAYAILLVAVPVSTLAASQLGPQPEPPDKPAVTLAKGTVCARVAAGRVRLTLPSGAVLELFGCRRDQKGQLIADKGHFAPAQGKQGWTAAGARIASGRKPQGVASPQDYVKIDDDITWLPAVVSFIGIIDPDPPPKP